MHNTAEIDTAGYDLLTDFDGTGHGFSGECRGVNSALAVHDYAVERYTLTGADGNYGADGYCIRIKSFELAVYLNAGIVGANVHKLRNRTAAFADGVALKALADAVEKHYRNGLGVFADAQRTDRCNRHKEALVK